MSRDFSPKICWEVNKQNPDLFISNIMFEINGKTSWMYTEDELADRRNHKVLQVLGADVYAPIRALLCEDEFEGLVKQLETLVQADEKGTGVSDFPEEMTTWFYNRHDHYYHEPNDEEFLEWVTKCHEEGLGFK